ncbi:MAG: hypothetical protein HWN66_12440 [Candidatus Helarchaeota archaeon]|nr:hypothetical protein [Candidatus Helarchaeota archaeon]
MGWLRKILWLSGGLILAITFITMLSQVYWEALGWDGINLRTYIFWYIFGSLLIVSMFIYDILSYLLLRSDVHRLMDETEQITPEEITRMLDEPLWRVLPIFRKREEPGILISISGKYTHFNETFEQKFLEQYSQGFSIGEIANHFNLSKKEINLIIDELDYKEALPEVEIPAERPKREVTTKGLRKTVRRRKKLKKKGR